VFRAQEAAMNQIAKHTLIFGSAPLGPEHLPVDAMDAARRSILNGLPISPPDAEHQS